MCYALRADYSLDNCMMGPECYTPYYLDYDWARWAEPAYNVPTLDMNWYNSHNSAYCCSDQVEKLSCRL